MLGFAYSTLNPLGEAPDEADHYAYAAYIGREHRLPDGAWMTQAKHPPLYHGLAAAAAAWTGMDFTFLRSNPDVSLAPDAVAPNFFVHTAAEAWPWAGGALAMHLGRLLSVLAGVVLVAATYALGRALWPGRPHLALAGAAVAALLPESLFVGGSMSNDMLAAMFSALALWLAFRAGPGFALATGAAMGLAFLSKVSTASLWPVVALALWLGEQPRAANRARLVRLGLAGGTALAIAAPWLLRNWQLYGDPLGMRLALATIDQRQGPLAAADLVWLARGWFFSFWGRFGGAGQIPLPAPFYLLWGGLLLLALAGWVRWLIAGQGSQSGLWPETSRLGWAVLAGAPLLTVVSILAYSRVALGTDQGRLLFPALAPFGLWLAGGWAAWLTPLMGDGRRAAWSSGGLSVALAGVAVLALLAGIVQPFSPPVLPAQAALAAMEPRRVPFGQSLELAGLDWAAGSDQGYRLSLYWRALQSVNEDYRVALRLSDAGGNLVAEWKRSPGMGRFSTDRWEAGRVVEDRYAIPEDAMRRAARIEVGVYAFPDGPWLAVAGPEAGEWLALSRP